MFNQKNILVLLLITVLLLVFSACSGGGGGSDSSSTLTKASLSGVAQKGPFLVDSNVSLCKLDEKMICTSEMIETKVTDDKGSYGFEGIRWSGLSKLTVSGHYFDEVTGVNSTTPATISAIVDIQSKISHKTNTNILTDIRVKRMKKLVDANKTLEEALQSSKEEVKELFNLNSDDFTALNLTDFSAGNAVVNVELLRISAAISKSANPVGDLEELMKIYNDGGLAAVLESSLYKKLMSDVEDVDVTTTLTNLGVESDVPLSSIQIEAFARASVYSNTQVKVVLFGTEFSSASPAISVSSTNLLSIDSMQVSADNKSVILDMNDSTSCQDVKVAFTLDYMTLVDAVNPVLTNEMAFNDPLTICNDVNDSGTVIVAPINQLPVAIIGMDYGNEEQAEKYISVNVGQQVPGLEASYSHDRDAYPFGGISHCQWQDEVGVIIKESNDASCDLYDLVFDNAGSYDYVLTVTDKVGAVDSNIAHITVTQNSVPVVSITPSQDQTITLGETLELNATASDADIDDIVTLQWMYQKVGTPTQYGAGSTTQFSHLFNEVGDYNISVIARDNHGAMVQSFVMVGVEAVPINNAPTVRISPVGDKNISLGDSVILKSIATDVDGDTLTTSWKLKNITTTEFTVVPNHGATGFNYTFDTLGTYLVVVEVEDGNGSVGDANITVNVTEPTPIVITLDDVNISVVVKGNTNFSTQFSHTQSISIFENPEHGTAEAYLVGGETWHLSYESTDCFIGNDSFVYQSGDEYGRVNVTITSPSTTTAPSSSVSLFNTEVLTSIGLTSNQSASITIATTGGSSSLVIVGGEFVHYNYDPDNSFVGADFFEYTISETINECSYSDVGRVDFDVSEYVTPTRVISACRDPHYIGTEMYRTDGTLEGTTLVKDLAPGRYTTKDAASTGFVDFEMYEKVGDMQYFNGYYSSAGARARELWQTDGTEEGTIVYDINDNGFTSEFLWGSSYSSNLNKIGEYMFFTASDSTADRYGTYRAGKDSLERIADYRMGKAVEMNGLYYMFVSDSQDANASVYKLNSDLNATELVEVFDKPQDGRSISILDSIGSRLIFTQYSNDKHQLFSRSIGGANIELMPDYSYSTDVVIKYNNKMYFVMSQDQYTGGTIVETDGTLEGTNIVYTFGDDVIHHMIELNGKLYFKGVIQTQDANYKTMREHNLYEYDISTHNVVKIADIQYGGSTELGLHMGMDGMKIVGGKIIYESVNVETVNGVEQYFEQVWASDGTSEGTVAIFRRDRGGAGSSYQRSDLRDMFELDGAYYFQDTRSHLFKTDFSEYGTISILDDVCDISPDSVYFTDVDDAELSTQYEANITIEGINYPLTIVSILNGEYSLDDGSSWSSEETTIQNGQKIKVRHTSSSSYDVSRFARLYVGEEYYDFTITTKTETISTPNQFIFTDVTNANVDTIQIANITVTGINVEVALSISGGEYSIDGTNSWNVVDTNVSNNQIVYVRHTSSASNETQVDTILTVGGVSDTFSSTTRAVTVGGDTVTVGSLMWEDTDHTRTATQTWSDASTYCSDLVLESYSNWRLPSFIWGEVNELGTIMTDSNSSASGGDRVINEPFVLITLDDNIWSWTNEATGEEATSHVVGIFSGGSENFDGLENSQLVGVRCVRDIE